MNATAKRRDCPSASAARATSATAPRLASSASAFNAHNPPATPNGAAA